MVQFKSIALSVIATAALAACGGGSSSNTGGNTAVASLEGVAAVGAALPNASVTLKDSTGKQQTMFAGADGAYKFADVTGMVAPLMVQATGTVGGKTYKFHSVLTTVPAAGVSGVLNVTPATESAVAQALGKAPATVFEAVDAGAQIKAVNPQKLADAKAKLVAALANVLAALGQKPTVDLFEAKFAADGTGLDKLLDTIQFQASDDGAGNQDVYITNKNTGATVAIAPATTVANVGKVVAPTTTDLALNTSGIKALIDAINVQAKTLAGVQSAAMLDLFDVNYLSTGSDRTTELADIAATAVGFQLLDYVLQGCDSTAKTCLSEITLKYANGSIKQMRSQVIQGADGKWRVYGDRSPFDFDLKPVVTADYFVTNGVAALSGSVQTGFNMWFPGKGQSSTTRLYKSALLQTSSDNGSTWSAGVQFAEKANCQGGYLPLVNPNNPNDAYNCSNFMTIADVAAQANNQATLAGQRKFKITAYPNVDYTGTPVVYEARSSKLNYTTVTGAAALSNYAASVTAADMGTNSVRFAGSPSDVQINTVTLDSNGGTIATGYSGWGWNQVGALGGAVSVAKANASCVANGSTQAVCDSSYGTNAKIRSVHLETSDPQGRGIWVNYAN